MHWPHASVNKPHLQIKGVGGKPTLLLFHQITSGLICFSGERFLRRSVVGKHRRAVQVSGGYYDLWRLQFQRFVRGTFNLRRSIRMKLGLDVMFPLAPPKGFLSYLKLFLESSWVPIKITANKTERLQMLESFSSLFIKFTLFTVCSNRDRCLQPISEFPQLRFAPLI